MKYATSNLRISSPLARSELHSAVQPPVNALGNHARTTVLPLSCESEYVLPSLPGNEKSGAGSPTLSSSAIGVAFTAALVVATRPQTASTQGQRRKNRFIGPPVLFRT